MRKTRKKTRRERTAAQTGAYDDSQRLGVQTEKYFASLSPEARAEEDALGELLSDEASHVDSDRE